MDSPETTITEQIPQEEYKKEDPHSPEATNRTCDFNLTNNWDVPITNVTVRHRSGKTTDQLSLQGLAIGGTTAKVKCNYQTGFGAPHDYWFVQFTASGGSKPGTWRCKDNFYCDLREGDEGKLVLTSVSIVDTDWYITEPSGRCYVSLSKT